MLGTGRMNRSGGAATITMPTEAVEHWEPGDDGLDMVWFTDGTRLFAVPKADVEVSADD